MKARGQIRQKAWLPQQMATEAVERARKDPNNFDAQVEAAQLYYQINRFDEAMFSRQRDVTQPSVRLGDAKIEGRVEEHGGAE